MPTLKVNARDVEVDAPQAKPLLWVLREDVALTGTKFGCGAGQCGSCTVLVDGRAVRSCQVVLYQVEGTEVQTIEGLNDELGRRLKRAWVDVGVAQCGFCQAGQIMSAHAILSSDPNVDEDALKQRLGNLCRCGTYGRIVQAVMQVAAEMQAGEGA